MTIMRSILNRKPIILLISFLGVIMLIILASGMNDVEFAPGEKFAISNSERPIEELNDRPVEAVEFGNNLAIWMVLLVIGVIVIYLLVPELRKRFLRLILNLGLTLFVLNYIIKNQLLSLPAFEDIEALDPGQLNQNGDGAGSASVFTPPDASSILSFVISFGMLFVFLFSAWYLFRLWRGMGTFTSESDTLPDLAAIARKSIQDISSGHDWEGVIQECYWRMSDAVDRNRGIKRAHSMTTGEFAERLVRAGLPGRSVQQLTRLFDDVRYGAHKSGKQDIDRAVTCLNDILQACGETP